MPHPRGPKAQSVVPAVVGDVARTHASPSLAVRLGPVGYVLAWTGVYLFHATCALYYLAAAKLLRATRGTPLIRYIDENKLTLSPWYFPAIATAHDVIGSIHVGLIAAPLVHAAYRVFTQRYGSTTPRSASVVLSRIKSVRLPRAIERWVPYSLHETVKTLYSRVFGRHGLLGIDSRQFDTLLLAREMLECGLQTYQAYQMCRSLPRRGLNRFFVLTLVANCWVTPTLHYLVKHQPLRRLLDRLFDVALDFLATIGVPLVLVASYAPLYEPELGGFSYEYWNNELWVLTMRSESPLVFFGSWVDVVSRLVFSLGLLLSLDDIKILLQRRRSAVEPHVSLLPPKPDTPSPNAKNRGARALRLGHGALLGFGVVILAVHLHSELRAAPTMCLLPLNPWLTAKRTCAIVEFSCYTNRAFTGDKSDFDSVFQDLNPTVLEQVSFRHCPSIDVQPSIRQFPRITSLQFYNSTVREWGADAALSNASHPMLRFAYFIRTNFTTGALPDGLAAPDFPRSIVDLIFSITNLQHFPDDLNERWPSVLSLAIEFSPLSEFPLVFARMQLTWLSLAASAITEMPAQAFQVANPMGLALSGNPIVLLPEDVVFGGGVYLIKLDSTELEAVPTWLLEAAAAATTYVTAPRTPYCASVAANASASAASTSLSSESSGSQSMEGPAMPLVDCTDLGFKLGSYDENQQVRESEVW